MTKTTTIAAAAVAALALPVGASAAKPEKPAKAAKPAKTQKVGFVATGTGPLPAADATSITLDPAQANTAALGSFGIKRSALKEAVSFTVADAVKGFTLVFEDGVTAATFQPTDRIKVIGKVVRTRTAKTSKDKRFTYGDVDVRKVVVSRPGADS